MPSRSQKGSNNRSCLSSRFPHEITHQLIAFTPFNDAKLINVNNLSEQCTAIWYEPTDDTVHDGRREAYLRIPQAITVYLLQRHKIKSSTCDEKPLGLFSYVSRPYKFNSFSLCGEARQQIPLRQNQTIAADRYSWAVWIWSKLFYAGCLPEIPGNLVTTCSENTHELCNHC